MICVLCTMVWYSLYVIFDNCLFIFSSENTMFSAGAIDFVIAGWLAGVSMVFSGTMGGEPESALSLPALCLRVNEDDVGCGGGLQRWRFFSFLLRPNCGESLDVWWGGYGFRLYLCLYRGTDYSPRRVSAHCPHQADCPGGPVIRWRGAVTAYQSALYFWWLSGLCG